MKTLALRVSPLRSRPDAVVSTKSKQDVLTVTGFEGSVVIGESLGEERVDIPDPW